jgi:hypothetical protein
VEGLRKTTRELSVGYEVLTAAAMKCSLLQTMLTICFTLVYSSAPKMEACSSEMSVDFQRSIWRYISEDATFQLNMGVSGLTLITGNSLILNNNAIHSIGEFDKFSSLIIYIPA